MSARLRVLLFNSAAFVVAIGALVSLVHIELRSKNAPVADVTTATSTQTAAVVTAVSSSSIAVAPATVWAPTLVKTTVLPAKNVPQKQVSTTSSNTPSSASSSPAQVVLIQDPYSTPPESFSQVNISTRAALVNILCEPHGSSSLRPISGSGVIIDPRGIILTNAHVAQYVLLSEDPEIDLSCSIRTGSPAAAHWSATVLYIPPVWVNAHAGDINNDHPTGTGEHDYALLRITGSLDGSPLPGTFPSLPTDTRDAIGFLGDQVLGASYPAEFIGGIAAQYSLYSVSSVSSIQQLLTFGTNTVDSISLGGVIEAQSGSSGGAVANAWGYLIGIITTTSDAPTTAQRDLRAITLSYINTDIKIQSGSDLTTLLNGNLDTEETNFNTNTAPGLVSQYVTVLSAQQ